LDHKELWECNDDGYINLLWKIVERVVEVRKAARSANG
jgi:hypothetical protein